MSVKINRVSCLSLDEDEEFYKRKAVLGDSICVYLYNGMRVTGFLTKIGNKDIVVSKNGVDRNIELQKIRSFVVMGRGEKCHSYFDL